MPAHGQSTFNSERRHLGDQLPIPVSFRIGPKQPNATTASDPPVSMILVRREFPSRSY